MPAAAASAQEGVLPVPTPVITKKLIIIKKELQESRFPQPILIRYLTGNGCTATI